LSKESRPRFARVRFSFFFFSFFFFLSHIAHRFYSPISTRRSRQRSLFLSLSVSNFEAFREIAEMLIDLASRNREQIAFFAPQRDMRDITDSRACLDDSQIDKSVISKG